MSKIRINTAPRDEREIVNFAAIWLPYGGPEAPDIFVKYGISTRLFYHRLQNILALHTNAELGISPELHRRLCQLAVENQVTLPRIE